MSAVSIFSLTEAGNTLAQRLMTLLPEASHQHKPDNFTASAQQVFSEGQRCIFICATGIVIRTLAPVLKNKHIDPAVLVLDEQGRFIIPLLSGHEGGANAWAATLAKPLSAELVITSAGDYTRPVYTVGMGCDRGCPQTLLAELLVTAKQQLDNNVQLSALASIDIKHNEQGLLDLAQTLNCTLQCFSAEQLRTVEDQLSVKSEIVFNEVGCYGVAEAAALMAAMNITGNPAELLVSKIKTRRATIAVARSYYSSLERLYV